MNIIDKLKNTMVLSTVKAAMIKEHKKEPRLLEIVFKGDGILNIRVTFLDGTQKHQQKKPSESTFQKQIEEQIKNLKSCFITCDFVEKYYIFKGVQLDGTTFEYK
jgi:hypothetical protein